MPKSLLSFFSLLILFSFLPQPAFCWWWRRSAPVSEPSVAESAPSLSAEAQFRRDASFWLGALATANPARRVRALHIPSGSLPETGPSWGVACGRLANDVRQAFLLFPPAAGGNRAERRVMVGMADKYSTLAGEAGGAKQTAQELLQAGQGLMVRGNLNPAAEKIIGDMSALLLLKLRSIEVVPLFMSPATPVEETAAVLMPFLTDPQTILIAFGPAYGEPTDINQEWRKLLSEETSPTPTALAKLPVATQVAWNLAEKLDWGHAVTKTASPSDAVGETLLHLEPPVNLNLLAQAAELNWDDQETKSAFRDATLAAGRSDYRGATVNAAEKVILLDLARRAITSHLENRQPPPLPVYSANLMQKHGCQMAIYHGEEMLGQYLIMPGQEPLAKAVVMNAAKFLKAEGDKTPLTMEIMANAKVAIGVLSLPQTLQYDGTEELYQKLAPDRHGVLLTAGGKQAGFLPVVWKQVPEPENFMAALAKRINQNLDCLTKPDTKVEVFEMEMFAENP